MENSKMFSVNGCDFIFAKHNVINSLREYEPKYDLMIYDGIRLYFLIPHVRQQLISIVLLNMRGNL